MTAKDERHVIWSNYDLDFDDWKDDLAEEYPDASPSIQSYIRFCR